MAKGAIRVDWYPVNALAGMKFLTPMEELAYRRIIDLLYTEGGALPDDDETMAEQTRTFKDWAKVKAGLIRKEKITVSDGQITNEKCTEVLTDIQQRSDAARASGKASGEKRRKLLPTKKERPLNDRSNGVDEKAPKPPTESELSHLVRKSVKEDADDSASAPVTGIPVSETDDWPAPAETAKALAETANLPSAQWQLLTASELLAWRGNGFSYLLDIVPTVTAVAGRAKRPPGSWSYFTAAIAQNHANRLKQIDLPEAQTHERRNPNYKTTGERNQDSTARVFGHIFGGHSAGEDEPFDADVTTQPLRIA